MAQINTDLPVRYPSYSGDSTQVRRQANQQKRVNEASQSQANFNKGYELVQTPQTEQSVVAQAAHALTIADRTHGWVFKEKNLNGRDYVLERPEKKIPVSEQHVPAGLGIQEMRRPKVRRVGL